MARKKPILKTVLVLLILFTGIHSFAQQDSTAAKKMTDRMKTQLTLTDDQYPKVLVVNASFANGLAELKDAGGGKLAKFRKIKALGNTRDKALKGILTKEQYALFEKQKEENKEQAKSEYKNKQ